MSRGTCLTIAGITMGAVMIAQPTMPGAQMQSPDPNKLGSWECTGPYGKKWKQTKLEVKDGMLRQDMNVDGTDQWLRKPVNLMGVSIFKDRDRNDGNGERGQKYDEDKLADVMALKPGGKANLIVDEWHSNGRWKWQYSIEIGKPKTLDHPVLGQVQAVTIEEKRAVVGGEYSSEGENVVVPELGIYVSWVYKDKEGTMTCDLTAYN